MTTSAYGCYENARAAQAKVADTGVPLCKFALARQQTSPFPGFLMLPRGVVIDDDSYDSCDDEPSDPENWPYDTEGTTATSWATTRTRVIRSRRHE
jgi:hypothetical protein